MQTWSKLYLFHLFSHQIFIMSMPNGNFHKLPLMTLSSLLQALVANMQFGRDLSPPWADAALLKASKPNLRKKYLSHDNKVFFSQQFFLLLLLFRVLCVRLSDPLIENVNTLVGPIAPSPKIIQFYNHLTIVILQRKNSRSKKFKIKN